MKIIRSEEFVNSSLGIIQNLIQKLEIDGRKYEIDKTDSSFLEFIEKLKTDLKNLTERCGVNGFDYSNKDNLIKECKNLLKDIFDSHVYKMSSDYNHRLNLAGHIPTQSKDYCHSQNLDSIPQLDHHEKKRDLKERSKKNDLAGDEMINCFSNPSKELNESFDDNKKHVTNEEFSHQISLSNLQEQFNIFEKRLQEDASVKEKLQAEIKELKIKNEE